MYIPFKCLFLSIPRNTYYDLNTNEFMAPGELIHANKTPGMLLRFAMHLQ